MKASCLAVCLPLLVSCAVPPTPKQSGPRIKAELPADWYVSEPGPPIVYRRKGKDTGWLHVSIVPQGEDASLGNALVALLGETGMDIGKLVESVEDKTEIGPMATSLYHSDSDGLKQFWLIDAGEEWVFASYTMGALAGVRQEMSEASQIIRKLQIE